MRVAIFAIKFIQDYDGAKKTLPGEIYSIIMNHPVEKGENTHVRLLWTD